MKEIKKEHMHPIQLKSVRVVSLKSSVALDMEKYDNKDVRIAIEMNNLGEVINSNRGKTFLKTSVTGSKKDDEKCELFKIELTYEGECETEESIEENEFKFFLDIQSVPMLWSFSRETINNCMYKMGLDSVLLPVLNISELMQKTNSKSKDEDDLNE